MKVTWYVEDVFISEISERERIEDRTGERLSYKVIKFRQKKDEKRSCLCFSEPVAQKLGVGLFCSLKGEVSFASGSTYLLLKHLAASQNLTAAGSQ